MRTLNSSYELLTLDVAPGGAGWAAGDTLTGLTSSKTCRIVEVLTTKTYTIENRSGAFTLGEVITNGTATADQGASYPTFTPSSSSAVLGALQNSNVPYLVLVELDFVEGTVRLTNASYSFDWNGYTWTGAGNLGSISPIEEGTDLQMYGVTLTLSGIASGYIAECLGVGYSGRSGTIWVAPLDENYKVIASPIIVFKGKMDTMPIKLGSQAAIQVTVESDLVAWERGKSRVFGDADQEGEHPGDKGLEFVAQMVDLEIFFGRPYPK